MAFGILPRALPLALCVAWACDTQPEPPPDTPDAGMEGEGLEAAFDGSAPQDARTGADAARFDAARSDHDGAGEQHAVDAQAADARVPDASQSKTCAVGPVPEDVREALDLDPFYRKYADADGVAVLGSNAPADSAIASACELVKSMLAERDDVRMALIRARARFAIIGRNEGTADIPEYGYGQRSQAERDRINQRARGLGGQVASCGEENIACLPGDRYRDESICIHEFAHTISTYGVYRADRTFEMRLTQAFQRASMSGILDGTYRKESVQEYWAEGVQDWFSTNASARPSNGIHNEVDTPAELEELDPTLHALVDEVFPQDLGWSDCHAN